MMFSSCFKLLGVKGPYVLKTKILIVSRKAIYQEIKAIRRSLKIAIQNLH